MPHGIKNDEQNSTENAGDAEIQGNLNVPYNFRNETPNLINIKTRDIMRFTKSL